MADNRWTGLDAALARMRGLAPELRKSAFRAAGVKAMQPVRDSARSVAALLDDPDTKSSISKAIVTRGYGFNPKEDGFVTKVGVQGGARPRKGTEDTGHWRFLELGTSEIRATPFMRPALENNVDKVITTYVQALNPAIDKALAKAARKAAKAR